MKGFVDVVVFGLIISILESGAGGFTALFALLLVAWILYMAFEAFHTAQKKQRGEPVDEFSSLVPLRIQEGSKIGPILLIGGGVVFLLVTLDVVDLYFLVRFWPVLLIALGAYMLYSRTRDGSSKADREVSHE